MMEQLPLSLGDRERAEQLCLRMRQAFRRVAEAVGIKVLATDWECHHGIVGQKLAQTDRHFLRPVEIADLLLRDVDGAILATLCEWLGYETPQKRKPLDPVAEIEWYRDRIERLPPELQDYFRRPGGRP